MRWPAVRPPSASRRCRTSRARWKAALQHTQSLAAERPQHGAVLHGAAEEMRRLLHQFAAGFLKEPDGLIEAHAAGAAGAEVRGAREESTDSAGRAGSGSTCRVRPSASRRRGAWLRRRHAPRHVRACRTAIAAASDADDVRTTSTWSTRSTPTCSRSSRKRPPNCMPQLGGALRAMDRAARQPQRPRRQCCAPCTRSRAAPGWPAPCGWASWRTAWSPRSNPSAPKRVAAADIEPLLHRFDGMQANFDACAPPAGCRPQARAVAAPRPRAGRATAGAEPAPVDAAWPVAEARQRRRRARRCWPQPVVTHLAPQRAAANQAVRVRSQLLDRLVNQAGEVMITRSRLEAELRPAARLAGRPDRQPRPPARAVARHRAAGRVADAVAPGAGQGLGRRASIRSSSTASPGCRNSPA